MPYRIAAGSLKPAQPQWRVMVLVLLTQLLLPIILILAQANASLMAGYFAGQTGVLAASAGRGTMFAGAPCALTAWLYWVSLDELGNMMERREQEILRAGVAGIRVKASRGRLNVVKRFGDLDSHSRPARNEWGERRSRGVPHPFNHSATAILIAPPLGPLLRPIGLRRGRKNAKTPNAFSHTRRRIASLP